MVVIIYWFNHKPFKIIEQNENVWLEMVSFSLPGLLYQSQSWYSLRAWRLFNCKVAQLYCWVIIVSTDMKLYIVMKEIWVLSSPLKLWNELRYVAFQLWKNKQENGIRC